MQACIFIMLHTEFEHRSHRLQLCNLPFETGLDLYFDLTDCCLFPPYIRRNEVIAILGEDLPYKFVHSNIDLPELQGQL